MSPRSLPRSLPRSPVILALRHSLGAFFISLIALSGCHDIDSPSGARGARSAVADKAGIPDTLPFHVQMDFRAAPGATPFACGAGISIPNHFIGQGTVSPHMGRSQSSIVVMACGVDNGIVKFTAGDTIAGATGDSLFVGWIATMPATRGGTVDLRIEILGLGGYGWYYRSVGAAMATGRIDLSTGSGSYRGDGSIAPPPAGSGVREPLLIPETISAGGGEFTCGLSLSGAAYCWGQNDHGQLGDGSTTDRLAPTRVLGGMAFREVSTGAAHACGLTTTGNVFCWGANSLGQLGLTDKTDHLQPTLVPGALVFIQLSAGGNQTCGRLTSGAAYCWGDNRYGQLGDGSITERDGPTPVSGGLLFNHIKTDSTHTCALTGAGAAYCWGLNSSGELGDSTTTARRTPTPVRGGPFFSQITVGAHHTCALSNDGTAYCWGNDLSGQLGDGGIANVNHPNPVTAGSVRFHQISAGASHTCAVATTGQAYCWGANNDGPIGDGSNMYRRTPVLVSTSFLFAQVSAGHDQSCGITTSRVALCWGYNARGEVGDNTKITRYLPVPVSSARGDLPSFTTLSAGMRHTCALTATYAAYCWGSNENGELGDGTTTQRMAPAPVSGGFFLSAISAGALHTCALRTEGHAVCWGANHVGQLGDGTTTDRESPMAVAGTQGFAEISAGNEHTCALGTGGKVYCWGDNTYGQLGDGTTEPRYEPTLVQAGDVVLWHIAAGQSHTCALTREGQPYCWGNYGGMYTSTTPVAVPAYEPLKELHAGDRITCGLARDSDRIYCWGINADGQLGDGTTNSAFTPMRITVADVEVAGIPLAQVGVGSSHVCVTALEGGAAYCAGWNYYGQLGDNSTTERHVQTPVYGALAFQWLAGGADHTCGLSSGAAYCWGRNTYGQLGTGDLSSQLVPTAVNRMLFKLP